MFAFRLPSQFRFRSSVKSMAACSNEAGGEPRSDVDDVTQAFAHESPGRLAALAIEAGDACAKALSADGHSVSGKSTAIASHVALARSISAGLQRSGHPVSSDVVGVDLGQADAIVEAYGSVCTDGGGVQLPCHRRSASSGIRRSRSPLSMFA